MTKFEKFMEKFDKFMIRFLKVIKYFSVLCIGAGITLIIEYGFTLDFILLVGLATVLLICSIIKLKEDIEIIEE